MNFTHRFIYRCFHGWWDWLLRRGWGEDDQRFLLELPITCYVWWLSVCIWGEFTLCSCQCQCDFDSCQNSSDISFQHSRPMIQKKHPRRFLHVVPKMVDGPINTNCTRLLAVNMMTPRCYYFHANWVLIRSILSLYHTMTSLEWLQLMVSSCLAVYCCSFL